MIENETYITIEEEQEDNDPEEQEDNFTGESEEKPTSPTKPVSGRTRGRGRRGRSARVGVSGARGIRPKSNNNFSPKTPNETPTSRSVGYQGRAEKQNAPIIKKGELVIQCELGKGVFGKVFKGLLRGSTVAVKELKSKCENTEQFETEISIMTQIRHPNIVLFMGASLDPPFLVTEYLEGGDLHVVIEGYEKRLKNQESVPMNEVLQLAIGIAKGMAWLHNSIPPIIHKDLKPTNIMLDSHGNAKIIDFGLSEEQKSKELENKKMSGSASWMAPEMLKGENYTEKIDVYAYGITLWQLVTGSPSIYNISKYDKMNAQNALQAFIQDITEKKMRPEIPMSLRSNEESIVNIIESTWHDDPKERPSFSTIVTKLHEIYISHTLKDTDAIAMWQKYFKEKVKGISVKDFYIAVWKSIGLEFPEEDCKSPHYIQQKCLEAVVGQTKTIDLERFGLLLNWYGPLCTSSSKATLLYKIETLLTNKWYHGELSSADAENILLSENDKMRHDFLIRASLHQQAPFTMSRIEGNSKKNMDFAHHRIWFSRSTGEYYMTFETKAGIKQEIRGTSLPEFVKNARTILQLKKPIQCRKFDHIFVNKETQGQYKTASLADKKKK